MNAFSLSHEIELKLCRIHWKKFKSNVICGEDTEIDIYVF